jgi:hypothetical protein
MHFQSTAEDILAETSDAELTGIRVQHAIRWYIHSYGGAESVAAFLRKCPWAPRVFAAAKKNRRREIELRNTFRTRRVAAASSATPQQAALKEGHGPGDRVGKISSGVPCEPHSQPIVRSLGFRRVGVKSLKSVEAF